MPEDTGIVFGKDKILLFRRWRDRNEGLDAALLVFQTDHTFTYSRELDRITTKQGVIVKVGGLESEVPIEAVQAKTDPTASLLKESVIKGEKLELWEITVDEEAQNEEGKYPAVYCQGYLDSWEIGANVDDESTVSSTFIVEKVPQEGYSALPEDVETAVQYAFREAVADGENYDPEGA